MMTVKTPFYYYDMELLENTLQTLNNAIPSPNFKVHYAIKANAEERVLELIRKHGFGADCVSGNEVLKALEKGFAPQEITTTYSQGSLKYTRRHFDALQCHDALERG